LHTKKNQKSKSTQKWGASFYIGLHREIYLKRSLSKTTELISNKFGRKHLWGMGIKILQKLRGWHLLGPRKRLHLGKFCVSENYSSRKPAALIY